MKSDGPFWQKLRAGSRSPPRKAQFDLGAVFRIEGGKIAEWWVAWDNMTILRALGHLPSG
jgi:hypothetical protein